ncbi:hypothetical protein K402DRAFT_363925 [Aulographum hederae CBS 113979]|uniref:F-box domain-containing protein n=1 Tax=Aulographum hederae CBS 113979 TaxID=1176131 RepID=A0A6G1GM61_9PEZI|nr:hypothetical protein K402DRAFT_363925 [Aulographum hederae CBS 113979]
MSNFKRSTLTGGAAAPSQRDSVLASLRQTKIVAPVKPVLPAELIATILDYLPVPELLRFARTAKRFREMVYDDTRWVQRIKSMGLWDEAEARRRFEEGVRRQREREKEEMARRAGVGGANGAGGAAGNGIAAEGKTPVTLFDAGVEEERIAQRRKTLEEGFADISLTANGSSDSTAGAAHRDPMVALKVLKSVRSIRGHARQEYGRVYGALAPYYLDLARSLSHTDPVLFRAFRDPEQQAQMLAQLKIFAKSDFAQGWHAREEKLETMIGIFENAVLREFEQGYDAGDYDGRMKRYAHVLVTLNGGVAGIDMFIQNHVLMQQKETLGRPLDCLPSVPNGSILLGPSHDFLGRLATALNEQGAVIDKVFPTSVEVLIPFVERVSEEILGEYLTTLFDEAHDRNVESYLKAVSGIFEQCLLFSDMIKPAKSSKDDFSVTIKQIIIRCFEPHIDLYLSEELDFFKKTSEAQVEAWEKRLFDEEASTESFFMANVNRQAAKRDFLTSFKKVVMMPVNVLPTIPLSSPFATSKPAAAQASSGSDALGLSSSRANTPLPDDRAPSPRQEAPTTELAAKAAIMNSRLEGIKSLFSIEIALNLIHATKSNIERAAVFAKIGGQTGEEAKEQCDAIFVQLLQILGTRHIKAGFDKAVNHLADYNPRNVAEHNQPGVAPLVTFLELVNVGDLIQQMVDVFYVQEMVTTKLTDRDDFLSPAVKEKKRFEQMLDERVAAGLNKGIDVLMDEVEYLCATIQQPTDFNPTASEQMMDIGTTQTATRIVDIVSSHTGMLTGSTDKNMLDVFNQEVGLRLFTALCKHLKRQRISIDGAIKLISDTNHYHAYISTLKNKSLTQYFDALRELSQIYLISPKHAKEIATIIADSDRYYGIFRAEEVYEFAERRADWFVVKRDVERAMYGIGCAVM